MTDGTRRRAALESQRRAALAAEVERLRALESALTAAQEQAARCARDHARLAAQRLRCCARATTGAALRRDGLVEAETERALAAGYTALVEANARKDASARLRQGQLERIAMAKKQLDSVKERAS